MIKGVFLVAAISGSVFGNGGITKRVKVVQRVSSGGYPVQQKARSYIKVDSQREYNRPGMEYP